MKYWQKLRNIVDAFDIINHFCNIVFGPHYPFAISHISGNLFLHEWILTKIPAWIWRKWLTKIEKYPTLNLGCIRFVSFGADETICCWVNSCIYIWWWNRGQWRCFSSECLQVAQMAGKRWIQKWSLTDSQWTERMTAIRT